MLATYPAGIADDDMAQQRLLLAWFRRQRLEARLLANEIRRLFVGDGGSSKYEWVDDEAAALSRMGVKPKHVDLRENHATPG